MQIPLQITIRDIEHSEALETHIRDKASKLDEFFKHVMSCRVVVEVPHKHHQQGKQFNVRIDIGVPGSEIVINRDHAEDVYVALRDAFDAAKRRLEDYAHRIRGDVKTHQPKRAAESAEEIDEQEDEVDEQ
jgi:ribosomal subunit interface protein